MSLAGPGGLRSSPQLAGHQPRATPRAILVTVLFLWIGAQAPGAAPTGSEEWQLTGSGYEGHESLPGLRKRAEAARREALGRIRSVLGLEPGRVPIHWVLDVSRASEPVVEEGPGGGAAPRYFEAGRTRFVGGTLRVELPARRYLDRVEGVQVVVAHEVAHAVLASALGTRERYRSVPMWFREGLAQWFSGEGELRVGERIASVLLSGRRAPSFLTGLGQGAECTQEEGYLAVSWIESRVGEAGLRRVCDGVSRGASLEGEIQDVLGVRGRSLVAATLDAATRRITGMLPPEQERLFLESLTVYRRGELEGAIRGWRRLLADRSGGALRDTLHYLLGKELLKRAVTSRERQESRGHLERVLESPGELWRPEALVLLGELLAAEGEPAQARSAWEEVLRAYGEDRTSAARARRNLEGAPQAGR